jgi:hypothetical protein
MTESSEHVRERIELAIGRAREGVGERIDEIETRLRGALDIKQQAAVHAPELILAGLTIGFIIGVGAGRTLVRAVQFGIPIAIAVKKARTRMKRDAT